VSTTPRGARRSVEAGWSAGDLDSKVGEDFYHVMVPAIVHAADLCNPTLDFQVRPARYHPNPWV